MSDPSQGSQQQQQQYDAAGNRRIRTTKANIDGTIHTLIPFLPPFSSSFLTILPYTAVAAYYAAYYAQQQAQQPAGGVSYDGSAMAAAYAAQAQVRFFPPLQFASRLFCVLFLSVLFCLQLFIGKTMR